MGLLFRDAEEAGSSPFVFAGSPWENMLFSTSPSLRRSPPAVNPKP